MFPSLALVAVVQLGSYIGVDYFLIVAKMYIAFTTVSVCTVLQ